MDITSTTISAGLKLVAGAAILILVLFVIDYGDETRQGEAAVRDTAAAVAERLSISLPEPAWTLDKRLIGRLLDSEFRDSAVQSIVIRHEFKNRLLFAKARDQADRPRNLVAPLDLPPAFVCKRMAIQRRGEALGSVEACLTDRFVIAAVRDGLIQDLIMVCLFILVAAVAIGCMEIGRQRAERYRLERESLAKSYFMANMSHELRTPLNSVIGFSEIIESEMLGPVDNDKYTGYAAAIKDSGRHLLGLINDILDISRTEAGEMTLDDETLDVAEIVESAFAMSCGRSQEDGPAPSLQMADDIPRLRADPLRIRQILVNLLTNAIKFTPRDGSVRLVACVGGDGGVLFKVQDTGIGIFPQDIERVTEAFVQVHGDIQPHSHQRGIGLGLSLVKSLVELHDASL